MLVYKTQISTLKLSISSPSTTPNVFNTLSLHDALPISCSRGFEAGAGAFTDAIALALRQCSQDRDAEQPIGGAGVHVLVERFHDDSSWGEIVQRPDDAGGAAGEAGRVCGHQGVAGTGDIGQ